jgi:hypothetical protein
MVEIPANQRFKEFGIKTGTGANAGLCDVAGYVSQ